MKSYLAKLADRATLGNVSPAISMRATPPDPFAEPLTDASPGELTSPIRRRSDSQLPQPEPISRLSPTPTGVLKNEVSKSVVSRLDKTEPEETAAIPIEHKLDPIRGVTRDERQVEERSSLASPDTADQQIDLEAMASLSHDLDRLASVQQDQVGLLKRADEFMADLLTSRSQFNQSRDADHDIPNQQTNSERLQPQTQKSSKRDSPPTRVAEPEPPSLVIGKLTVEVSSPTPPQPQSPITVVHVRNQPRGGVPSSRRFGLGQF